jgi:hypothetical protein
MKRGQDNPAAGEDVLPYAGGPVERWMRRRKTMWSGRPGRIANDEFKRSYSTSFAVGLIVAVALHAALFTLLPSALAAG